MGICVQKICYGICFEHHVCSGYVMEIKEYVMGYVLNNICIQGM